LRRRPPRPTLFPYTTLFRSSVFVQRRRPILGVVHQARDGPIAQWLEHPAHNRRVAGSIPAGPTTVSEDIPVVDGRQARAPRRARSEEHTSELQSLAYLVCRL